ncbi:MAG: hypothetical protein CM15mP50_5120 [Rhodobacterales bacterium]|nr:MAG: hypothetical protein CM15mP50_5120 [Rhodobacterales bacterium]
MWEYAPEKKLISDFQYKEFNELSISTNLSQDQILNSFQIQDQLIFGQYQIL